MKNIKILFILIAILALALLMPGCGCGDDDDNDTSDDDDDDNDTDDCDEQTHDPLIVSGKQYLSDMNPEDAYTDFADALAACPDSADAKTGMLIARAQWLTLWFFDTLENPPFKGVGEDLQDIFTNELLPISGEMMELADDLLANYKDVRFFVDPLPFVIDDGHELLELGGEWDRNDIANAKAYARIWEGAGRMLLALDLVYDEELFVDNPVPEDATLFEQIHHYTDLLRQMFNDSDYDDFLTLEDGGLQSLADAASNIGLGLREIKTNIYATRDELDDQEDDICGYVDENGNGVWDEGECFRVPYFGALVPEVNDLLIDLLDTIDAMGMAFLDRGPYDAHPPLPDWFLLSELNFLLELTDVLDPTNPIRLPPIPIPVGRWFYMADQDGWRPMVELVVDFLWGITQPAP